MFHADWSAVIQSGVAALGYRYFLLTLTAPSFGRTHRAVSRQRAGRCSCGLVHASDDRSYAGAAVDRSTYDYFEAVRWNRDLGQLWDATRARLRKRWPSLEYAVVREWQRRGALHTHAIIRLPGDVGDVSDELVAAAQSVQTRSRVDGEIRGWGPQSRCDVFAVNDQTHAAVKYLTKSVGYVLKDVSSGRLHAPVGSPASEHLKVLDRVARWAVSCGAEGCSGLEIADCSGPSHRSLGATARVVSVSRAGAGRAGWSLTGLSRGARRAERRSWAVRAQAGEVGRSSEEERSAVDLASAAPGV